MELSKSHLTLTVEGSCEYTVEVWKIDMLIYVISVWHLFRWGKIITLNDFFSLRDRSPYHLINQRLRTSN